MVQLSVITLKKTHLKCYMHLLYRQECFSGKQTTRKVHTKLHPGLELRIFHILTSEDINDVISCFYTVFVQKYFLSV